MALWAWALGAGALFTGVNMFSKMMGSDPDFTNAWRYNLLTGQGGFGKTYFSDGLRSMFMGSRSMSAMMGSPYAMGGYPFGASLYNNPMMFSQYGMNPMGMGGLPYGPLGLGARAWC